MVPLWVPVFVEVSRRSPPELKFTWAFSLKFRDVIFVADIWLPLTVIGEDPLPIAEELIHCASVFVVPVPVTVPLPATVAHAHAVPLHWRTWFDEHEVSNPKVAPVTTRPPFAVAPVIVPHV